MGSALNEAAAEAFYRSLRWTFSVKICNSGRFIEKIQNKKIEVDRGWGRERNRFEWLNLDLSPEWGRELNEIFRYRLAGEQSLRGVRKRGAAAAPLVFPLWLRRGCFAVKFKWMKKRNKLTWILSQVPPARRAPSPVHSLQKQRQRQRQRQQHGRGKRARLQVGIFSISVFYIHTRTQQASRETLTQTHTHAGRESGAHTQIKLRSPKAYVGVACRCRATAAATATGGDGGNVRLVFSTKIRRCRRSQRHWQRQRQHRLRFVRFGGLCVLVVAACGTRALLVCRERGGRLQQRPTMCCRAQNCFVFTRTAVAANYNWAKERIRCDSRKWSNA